MKILVCLGGAWGSARMTSVSLSSETRDRYSETLIFTTVTCRFFWNEDSGMSGWSLGVFQADKSQCDPDVAGPRTTLFEE